MNAQDLGGLLLLHSSTGNREGMLSLAEDAKKAGRTNVAFLALFVCGKVGMWVWIGVERDKDDKGVGVSLRRRYSLNSASCSALVIMHPIFVFMEFFCSCSLRWKNVSTCS